ncbi:hypothetical protein [Granulicoccus phenolivorans]|uniref:hypothetical protein n=1 Tax=Granulicoccus phenolivorans TaxID=266854 RepID=UPI00041D18F4|nr:hypothetical protein [Granulicoccus phenolivorans]
MYLIRISLPNRAGMLGQVASALGAIGADIHAVEVVSREEDRAVDDFIVALPDGMMPDNAVSACTQIDQVHVLWCSRYPSGGGLETDMETLELMVDDPDHAAEALLESAPVAFHSQWAALVDRRTHACLAATALAPDLQPEHVAKLAPSEDAGSLELPHGWYPDWVETVVASAPVRGDRAIVVGRSGGPPYVRAEVARLRYLASMVPEAD